VNTTFKYYSLLLSITLLLGSFPTFAAPGDDVVEVMVFGTIHLRQHDMKNQPIATDMIRRSLAQYQPDLIVVEWLHPSLYQGTPHRYSPIENREQLAEQWGIRLDDLKGQMGAVQSAIQSLTGAGLPVAELRILAGKLHYLQYDPLNAWYQWYLADIAGADVQDVWHLGNDKISTHELAVWGFAIAREMGHEYIAPFDHQSEDTRWLGGEMQQAVKRAAIAAVHALAPGDEGYDEISTQIDTAFQKLQSGDMSLIAPYAQVPSVQAYLAHMQHFGKGMQTIFAVDNSDGLGLIRTLNTEEAIEWNRAMYADYMRKIPAENIGERTFANYQKRNEHMVDYLLKAVDERGSKRVLVIVGAGHKSFVEDILGERGCKVVPSTEYLPSPTGN